MLAELQFYVGPVPALRLPGPLNEKWDDESQGEKLKKPPKFKDRRVKETP